MGNTPSCSGRSKTPRVNVDAPTDEKEVPLGRRHPVKEDRVIIVGGGPAGVHMAYLLKEYGIKQVTVIEEDDVIGGKSRTVLTSDAVPHEMGTCFLHAKYHRLRALIKKYDLGPVVKPGGKKGDRDIMDAHLHMVINDDPNVANIVKPTDNVPHDTMPAYPSQELIDAEKHVERLNLSGWMFGKVEKFMISRAWWWLPDKLQAINLKSAARSYRKAHERVLGKYSYGLPPKPSPDHLKELNVTFADFLINNDAKALVPLLLLAQTAQGYGLLDEIPALYGLWWITPDLIDNFLGEKLGGEPTVLMFKPGFQFLFEKLAKLNSLFVRLRTRVVSVDRRTDRPSSDPSGASAAATERRNSFTTPETTTSGKAGVSPILVSVVSTDANGVEMKEVLECDWIIYTAPLKPSLQIFQQPTDTERKLFGALSASTLTTTLYHSNPLADEDKEHVIRYWPHRLHPPHLTRLYAERNSIKAVNFAELEKLREQGGDEVKKALATRHGVLYQYNNTYEEDESKHAAVDQHYRDVLQKDLKLWGMDLDSFHEHYFKVWMYFPRFSQEDLQKGYPWELLDAQGLNRTWYGGSSACFESVEDVICYNHLLCDNLLPAARPAVIRSCTV